MLANLITALGVAALSIQTPSNIQPQEPKKAYYDSSAVADYGTTSSQIYNYTSKRIITGESDGLCGGSDFVLGIENNAEFSFWDGLVSFLDFMSFYPLESDYVVQEENHITTLTENDCLDVYVNGEFLNTIYASSVLEGDPYSFSISAQGISASDYIWLFDHQTQSMSETIAEVVGDATTAGAAIIGAGFTGVISLFYNNGLTGLGIISLILVGVSLVWFAFALIMRLWRRR